MGKIITVAAHKGGVAKTTTVLNLAAAFGINGYKVLIVDTDSQENASTTVTETELEELAERRGIFEMMMAFGVEEPSSFVSSTNLPNVDIILSNVYSEQLGNRLEALQEQHGYARYVYLSSCIETLRDDYDIILIDTPPQAAGSPVVQSALYAADEVLVMARADRWALNGVQGAFDAVANMRRTENADINILGILLARVNPRTTLTKDMLAMFSESDLKDYLFKSFIHSSELIDKGISYENKPIVMYAKKSQPAQDYWRVYSEICSRIGMSERKKEE